MKSWQTKRKNLQWKKDCDLLAFWIQEQEEISWDISQYACRNYQTPPGFFAIKDSDISVLINIHGESFVSNYHQNFLDCLVYVTPEVIQEEYVFYSSDVLKESLLKHDPLSSYVFAVHDGWDCLSAYIIPFHQSLFIANK